jgi:pyruvate kinase
MVTTDIIIQAMNSIANESQLEEVEEEEEVVGQQPAENSAEMGQITEKAEETPSRDLRKKPKRNRTLKRKWQSQKLQSQKKQRQGSK